MHCTGSSRTGANMVAALLNAKNGHGFGKATWVQLEEQLVIQEIELGHQIVKENIEKEKSLSLTDNDTVRSMITCEMDSGWNIRGSKRNYNSDSEEHWSVGVLTNLTINVEFFKRCCNKCECGIEHDEATCSRTYAGSLKGMESMGTLKACMDFLESNCFLDTVVIDDESSSRAILKHPFQQALDAGIIDTSTRTHLH